MNKLSMYSSNLIKKIADIPTTQDTVKIPSVALIDDSGKFSIFEINNIHKKISNAIAVYFKFNENEDFKAFLNKCFNKESFSVCTTYNALRKDNEVAIILNLPVNIKILGKNNYAQIEFDKDLIELLTKGII